MVLVSVSIRLSSEMMIGFFALNWENLDAKEVVLLPLPLPQTQMEISMFLGKCNGKCARV